MNISTAQGIAAAAIGYALYQTAPTWLPWLRRATDWIERRYGVDLPELPELTPRDGRPEALGTSAPGSDAVAAAWQLAQALEGEDVATTRERFRKRIEAGALLALSDLATQEPT